MKKLPLKHLDMIFFGLTLLGAAIGFKGVTSGPDLLLTVGLGIVLVTLLLRMKFFRCPHCGKYLDKSDGTYCPYCKKQID